MRKQVKIIHCPISEVVTLFFTMNLFSQQDLIGLVEIVETYRPKHIFGIFLDKVFTTSKSTMNSFVHNGIGSDFIRRASPNVPLFFAHHAFLDKIWFDRQNRHKKLYTSFLFICLQNHEIFYY